MADSSLIACADTHWLLDVRLQAVLRAQRAIAFEFDLQTGTQAYSPFIGEYLAGNYDGRLLSTVMLEDGVLHPDDADSALQFREMILSGKGGIVPLRLRVPAGDFRWFRMTLTPCPSIHKDFFVGVYADIDEEVRQREVLRWRAEYDSVSGIHNKEKFYETTCRMLSAAPSRTHFLLRFDICRFKIINQMYSISEGDLVLRHVGQSLRALVMPSETFARIGSDIFCVCLDRTGEETMTFIRELEERVNTYEISFQFVLSFGILRITDYDGEPISILCDRAAMAQASVKGNFVQRYAFYDNTMSDALSREHYITGYMSQALENGQFQIYLQPKVDMTAKRVVGAETLARWFHPLSGMIPPGDFIPLFERNGFILRLDEYIWDLTCAAIRRWIDMGLNPPTISVNVSRMHLHDPAFRDKVIALVDKYQIPPHLLELEITESAYTENQEVLYEIMDALQERGILFSMDDFGSGYSSLNALKDIPVDLVKIDLNFLKDARRGAQAGRGILKGALGLMRELNLSTVVEGVETREQAEYLLGIGFTLAQGFYYARPMPVEDFEQLLQSGRLPDTQP